MKIATNFPLIATDYASQGNSIIGIRGSGKSYTAMKNAEELLEEKIPILVFDPSGIWRHLRDGVNGHEGYPIVVVGGVDPDIPVTTDEDERIDNIVEKIVLLMKAARERGISVVVDLYAMPKNHWQKIVVAVVRFLLKQNHNYGMIHVFFEEAAEFIPQRPHPGNAEVYGLIEQMARVGRNFGIGYTLINQRAEEIAKAVFELCEMVFVHRQRGKNSLKSIRDWLDHQDIAEAKGMVASIPKLENGECWIISDKGEKKVKILPKKTFHPSPKEGKVTVPHDVKVADRSAFIEAMTKQMNEVAEKKGKKKETEDEDNLQKWNKSPVTFEQQNEILALEEKINVLQEEKKTLINQLSEVQVNEERYRNHINAMWKAFGEFCNAVNSLQKEGEEIANATRIKVEKIPLSKKDKYITMPSRMNEPIAISHDKINNFHKAVHDNIDLPAGEKKTLIACAQYDNMGGLSRPQIRMMTDYKRSSSDAFIQRLKTKSLLIENGDKFKLTPQGKRVLGRNYQTLPSGKALAEYFLRSLPAGEAKILEICVSKKGWAVPKDYIEKATGYKRSSRDAFIQRLATRELVTANKAGVKASDFLF